MTASMRPIVFSDFDGTITLADVTDEILTRFGDPQWRDLERRWMAGEIGSRECLERQLALVRTTPKLLDKLIDSIPVDPGFLEFVRFVRQSAIPLVVVSDGLDCVIRRVLAQVGLHSRGRNGLHFYSSSARLANGRLTVSFPHAAAECAHGCATCKPAVIRRLKANHWPVVYIGDGGSDRYAVTEADFVYARRPLAEYCIAERIPFKAFETFFGVEADLARWRRGEEAELSTARLRPALAE